MDHQTTTTNTIATETPRGTATYSPDDNKLRFYPLHRLCAEHYKIIKDAGFSWAPKQELFVTPMWTPAREDLLLSWCGEIEDEDKSLVERAEERAERFEGYREKRADDAERAHAVVASITEHIPLGQPILVGHHSEKRARKDVERIQNGTRKVVKLWETSTYWAARAQGAIFHAKYKERIGVRARRIKGLEAEQRKRQKQKTQALDLIKAWSVEFLTRETALHIANYSSLHASFPVDKFPRPAEASQYEGQISLWSAMEGGIIDHTQARDLALPAYRRSVARCDRWLTHYGNRLTYERAMLQEAGGLAADRFEIETGGQVLVGNEWLMVVRLNRKEGRIVSVSTNARYVRVRNIEEIKDYRASDAATAEKVKQATKLPPLCNYPQDGAEAMTKADYDRRAKAQMAGTKVIAATPTAGAHRLRHYVKGYTGMKPVFITDMAVKQPPKPEGPKTDKATDKAADTMALPRELVAPAREPGGSVSADPRAEKFATLKKTVAQGIKVIAVPQLFSTPPDLADRMVELVGIAPGHAVLEPSAGTGTLLEAIRDTGMLLRVLAVEINPHLVHHLTQLYAEPLDAQGIGCHVLQSDFLKVTPADIGTFDRIVMNPPFADAIDIQHIKHAMTFLNPGGRLVAICANGPRQREQLMSLATHWEDLPQGSFATEGTMVNAALLVI